MDLSKIISISGHPGLFRMVSRMKSGLIVESLLDGKRMPAYATQKLLTLQDISIYTDEEDVKLAIIFQSLLDKTKGKAAIDHRTASPKEMGEYLATVLPNYDRDRVHNSDIKKLFQWYNLLIEKGVLPEKEEEKAEEKPTKKETEKKTKPSKAAAEPTEDKAQKKAKKPAAGKK